MKFLTPLLILAGFAWPPLLSADVLDDAVAVLERQQMRWLNEQQTKPGVVIDQFKTDGCSGGMSTVWTYLADVSPDFAERLGEHPPWENCCVAHDRQYWQGESVNGYEKRLQADESLRQCVRQSAIDQSEPLARSLGLSTEEVKDTINLTADLMYAAVRAGGGPCTGLPWRWGHGWPACDIGLPVVSE